MVNLSVNFFDLHIWLGRQEFLKKSYLNAIFVFKA